MPKTTDFEKKTPREHVLARPDTYIGDIEKTTGKMDIYNIDTHTIENEEISYVPGLYKCFDELLVNARDASQTDKKCDTIKVEINQEKNYIRITNNGNGIPLDEHPEHKMLVPHMIFGEMLTSSNYDDTKARTTGGRNGYGAKLANIFSEKFEVEIVNKKSKKKYKQTWTENMNKFSKPKITDNSGEGYVQVTFYPDLKKFGLDSLTDDHFKLFHRRTMDIACVSSSKMKVFFNGKKINENAFKKYIELYYPKSEIFFDESNERWKIGCLYIPDSNSKVVSFVNGISTYNGGTHVNHVCDQVVKPLIEAIKKKEKDLKITPAIIKDNLVFFVNSVIENPAFSSQTKDTLTTKVVKFGSSYKVNDTFIKKLMKSGIMNLAIQLAKVKEESQIKRQDGSKTIRLKGIPKLEDANLAGGRQSKNCALILTEGDSAKAFAMAGLSIIGRDKYGVFPLKGKLLNVREASVKQRMGNDEITNLSKIIGFKHSIDYKKDEEYNKLRYGKIIILTDQDVDGSHIKGLLINYIQCLYPGLVERNGFITSLSTPIVKAFKGKEEKIFYNLTEYDKWKEGKKNWKIKYYKGLGTSTSKEAKEYFHNIESKLVLYQWSDDEGLNAITLAFEKSRADDRKKWLLAYDKDEILENSEKKVSYENFINLELKHFSNDDNMRSIPCMIDGLKPSQRKILFGSYLRNLDKDEVKVSQLAGFVSDKACYHHGEASLMGAIVGMAQNYVGSNNVNVLVPNGQFGTRLKGGKDSASPRYIWTQISDTATKIFRKSDFPILNHQVDDGIPIEPEYYAPIVPMILVNGCEGIGTGFSTKIPPHNLDSIINNIYRIMDGDKFKFMKPYWNNFQGNVKKIDKNNFEINGVYETDKKNNTIKITELPVGEWTTNYKEFLEKQLENKQKHFIGYKDNNTDVSVYFELQFDDEFWYSFEPEEFEKKWKLVKKYSTTNMHLYNKEGRIQKYNSVKEILYEYYEIRLELYQKRKDYQLNILKNQLDMISYKVKFILMILEKKIKINNKKKKEIETKLEEEKFPKFDNNYNYLLGMQLYSLTYEKIEELKKTKDEKEAEYNKLKNLTPCDMWRLELEEIKN
jgi:DNA topoisomerase II